jgi:hypothetical protein
MARAAKNKDYVNKGELDFHEGNGVGWHPDYVKKFRGTDRDKTRYDKMWSRLKMLCNKCKQFDKTVDKADGSHCRLGKGVKCTK